MIGSVANLIVAKEAKKDRRIKTIEKQITELKNLIVSLERIVAEIKQNKDSSYSFLIFKFLRSLLFWATIKKTSYNPLLFRRWLLPLPVYYAFPKENEANVPNILKEASFHLMNNQGSLFNHYEKQIIIDFQEWLETEIVISNNNSFRYVDLIFDAANTISPTKIYHWI